MAWGDRLQALTRFSEIVCGGALIWRRPAPFDRKAPLAAAPSPSHLRHPILFFKEPRHSRNPDAAHAPGHSIGRELPSIDLIVVAGN
jgi:hypothetical protein